jgi:hypothetical protein
MTIRIMGRRVEGKEEEDACGKWMIQPKECA